MLSLGCSGLRIGDAVRYPGYAGIFVFCDALKKGKHCAASSKRDQRGHPTRVRGKRLLLRRFDQILVFGGNI